jgi:C-terminal processing protease CtpA/Prc
MIRGGPAAQAGLELGDVIVKIDGDAVRDASDVNALWGRQVGTSVKLTVERKGRSVEIPYKVTEIPQSEGGRT